MLTTAENHGHIFVVEVLGATIDPKLITAFKPTIKLNAAKTRNK